MKEATSSAGWVFGGIVALLLAGMVFYLTNLRLFDRFIHFDGAIQSIRPLGSNRVLVIENVETGGGEDGPSEVGDRWRILDVVAGKTLVGPHLVDRIRWAVVQGDQLVMMGLHDLEVHDFDNRLVANLASFKGVRNLRHEANDVALGIDGGVTALDEDGRLYALDFTRLQVTAVKERGPSDTLPQLATGGVDGVELRGRPRAQINGSGPEFLEPQWLMNPQTRAPIHAAGGLVLLHYQRMSGSKEGRGPMLSAVTAQGVETWRYTVPFPNLVSVLVLGDLLVLGIDERPQMGPSWIRVLSLSTGQETLRIPL